MLENFWSDIIQTMKCFALESFNLSCQAEHTKIDSQLNFNPGLALLNNPPQLTKGVKPHPSTLLQQQ